MSLTATAVKRYVCEYAPSSAFNYAADEVYDMLTDHNVEIWQSDEYDNHCDWEINGKETLQKYVKKLKKLPPDAVNKYFKKDKDNAYVTNQYVIDVLEEWIDCYDEEDRVIRVHWY
jgi:cell fate (sporulation/competence/biofilm development) regulator YmcA (YheA/YmcA/DUF963 family)